MRLSTDVWTDLIPKSLMRVFTMYNLANVKGK
jgi:hypothetical protein